MLSSSFSRRSADFIVAPRAVALALTLAMALALTSSQRCAAQNVDVQLERLPPARGGSLKYDDQIRQAAATIPPSADGPAYLDDYSQDLQPEMRGPVEFQHSEVEPPGYDLEMEQLANEPTAGARPKGAKPGMLQRTTLRGTWLAGGDGDQFGMTDLTAQAMLAVPLFIRGTPLLLTPNYTAHYLDGPDGLDVPGQLYDAGIEIRWMNQLTDRWGVDIAVAPTVFSDFENTSSDAFRITGRAIGSWQWTPATQLVVGAVYLGRDDFVALPVAGLIWKPDDDTSVEVIMPRPRIAKRFSVDGDLEHWWYVGGEFGGNTWAIERSDGTNDNLTYSDLRLVLGIERKLPGGLAGRIEAGYVFTREIEFESELPGLDPDDTAMLRGEVSF